MTQSPINLGLVIDLIIHPGKYQKYDVHGVDRVAYETEVFQLKV